MSKYPQLVRDGFKDFVEACGLGSPIEEEFYWAIIKYLGNETELHNQFPAKAQGYKFAIDFVIVTPTGKIGIECDGKEFHNFEKDQWRDRLILNAGIVDAIIRFRGSDINFRIHDAFYAMSAWYPEVFSDRGTAHIERLATSTARTTEVWSDAAHYFYHPVGDEEDLENPVDDKFGEGFGELHLYRRQKGDR